MPLIKQSRNIYECKFCGRQYYDLREARDCEAGHDIVYVPIERADLKRLLLFLVTGEKGLLREQFLQMLTHYNGIKSE